jgi:hypothetical protein
VPDLSSAAGAQAHRSLALLEGSVLTTILRLAAPNFLLAALQAAATFADLLRRANRHRTARWYSAWVQQLQWLVWFFVDLAHKTPLRLISR